MKISSNPLPGGDYARSYIASIVAQRKTRTATPSPAASTPPAPDVAAVTAAARKKGYSKGHAAGVAAERERLAGIVEVSHGDAAFALAQFNRGANRDEAFAAYLKHREAQQAAARRDAAASSAMLASFSDGHDPVASHAGTAGGTDGGAPADLSSGLSPGLQRFADSLKLPPSKQEWVRHRRK